MMYVEYYEKEIEGKGKCTYSKKFIPKDTLIWELTDNQIFTKEEYNNLQPEIKKDAYPEGDHYVRAGGDGENWNHSCDANTWWTSDSKLSAKRDILPDEEITYDYASTDIDPSIVYTWNCKCGASDCRGRLHWNDILKPEVYAKNKGHLPSWVEEFYRENTRR